MASSTSRPPQTDAHPISNDNNNHDTPLPTTENKNCEDPPGNAEDNKNNKNTDTNDNNDDDNNKDKIEHDGTEEATTTGTDTVTTTTDDEQLNTATHERNDGTENESNNMGSDTATPIERKGGAHKGNIITSHHMRIQDTETTETQQHKDTGKAVESTESTSDPKIPSETGINNSDYNWAELFTDDEHMESPNNSDNENRADGPDESRIEETIIF